LAQDVLRRAAKIFQELELGNFAVTPKGTAITVVVASSDDQK